MIFGNNLPQEYSRYKESWELFASFSALFSDSEVPFIHYRLMENTFCDAFGALNLSRTDTAFDASCVVDGVKYGIGLKTFIASVNEDGSASSKQEKIAEFNKDGKELIGLSPIDAIKKVVELRNARIDTALVEYGIEKSLYHCALRYCDSNGKAYILLKEYPYEKIDVNHLVRTDKNYNPISEGEIIGAEKILHFTDGKEKYAFNFSKSTLFKRFDTSLSNGINIPVKVLENPAEALKNWFKFDHKSKVPGKDYVVLPLYSSNKKLGKYVPEKSGLNQWNAGGRKRTFGEMYVPVPIFIHKECNDFFPKRGKDFVLITPTGKEITVSLCQGGGKALMSYPNLALSAWFHPLLVKDGSESIVNYLDFKRINKDAIKIEKMAEGKYSFSLVSIGSWEKFQNDVLSSSLVIQEEVNNEHNAISFNCDSHKPKVVDKINSCVVSKDDGNGLQMSFDF